ncbi:MAG: sulfatase-like hydrolase/transferase [Alteromonadaceae bacterium]|nr:sulfatase-like hydrolase/transferase [Alteromonadaceae bacterium]
MKKILITSSKVVILLINLVIYCVVNANTLTQTPNIILIVSDDQGYADISATGLAEDVKTPNLDRLAKQGTRLTSSYVTAPICNVYRLGLITGTYNQRQGAYWYGKKASINPKLTSIAEILKPWGYVSGYVGNYTNYE